MLKMGSRAPAFALEADSGDKISLKDLKGKTVVLYFYPKDLTPGCTQESCDFRDAYAVFKTKKIVVLGISKDPIASHRKFKEKHDLPFPLLADIEGKMCEAYGVWKEKSLYGRKYMGIERSTFVIDTEGKISKIYDKVRVKGHIHQILADLGC